MELNHSRSAIQHELTVFFALALFGVCYNALTERMERAGYHHGYLSFIVSIGVAGTLFIAGIRDWRSSVRFFFYFIGSGTPMILGSIRRYVNQIEQDKRDLARVGLK